ncbi:hypothetical protein EVAR_9090_1 [Eumeta japonica]|uniref:Uncharacterized protein n=1 Tax=Eumeta variegata TaxID=151549 RepID=A0A4C1TWE6_EUMVA|nr:hypothetical protein EVAR_9090_1 [Eumeta japonica]
MARYRVSASRRSQIQRNVASQLGINRASHKRAISHYLAHPRRKGFALADKGPFLPRSARSLTPPAPMLMYLGQTVTTIFWPTRTWSVPTIPPERQIKSDSPTETLGGAVTTVRPLFIKPNVGSRGRRARGVGRGALIDGVLTRRGGLTYQSLLDFVNLLLAKRFVDDKPYYRMEVIITAIFQTGELFARARIFARAIHTRRLGVSIEIFKSIPQFPANRATEARLNLSSVAFPGRAIVRRMKYA